MNDKKNSGSFSESTLASRMMCDWDKFSYHNQALHQMVINNKPVEPRYLLPWSDEPAIQLQCAKQHTKTAILPGVSPINAAPTSTDGRIRVGYLSSDFRNHVVAQFTVELFELHNRDKFEVFGFALGAKDDSETRKHLINAFDHFIEVGELEEANIATLIAGYGIHILVDLNGYSISAQPRILAMRPAPVQVNYLGYIGTMGADFIDYTIVDDFSVPPSSQPFYTEQLVHLPCYMAHDRRRAVNRETPSRAEAGLPEEGFVYCCFNSNYKITPEIFDIWMRCLNQVPGSVLWLLKEDATAEKNLRKEAQARGVDPDRLVFAPRMNAANHLARQRLADLFLDTLPVNAGATACDALWIGLPLLTCPGKSFVARMAGGLVHAAGLPELVVDSLEAYEALAIKLAREKMILHALRDRLIANRSTSLLFDSEQLRDNIEAAFIKMWENWCAMHNKPIPHAIHGEKDEAASSRKDETVPLDEQVQQALRLHQQGDLHGAEKGYQAVLEIDPQQLDALQLLGVINTQRGNINKAITLYKQALEVNPQFFAVYNNLGSAYYSQGMYQAAADSFLHATTLKPSAESYYNLGNCMYELQRYEEATRHYKRALDIDPAHENAANNIKASRAKLAR